MRGLENNSWPLNLGQVLWLNLRTVRNYFLSQLVDNEPNPSPPDVQFILDYVFGYRCADSRQNLYFNAEGQAVYMTAALGVIFDPAAKVQKFFGGCQVDLKAKNVSND